jgi:RHS repeat-associated protein
MYAPFGETENSTGTIHNFTGDLDYVLQDSNDGSGGGGFYDTPARELRANQGRWISPDPVSGNPANPQSWNKYAYV